MEKQQFELNIYTPLSVAVKGTVIIKVLQSAVVKLGLSEMD